MRPALVLDRQGRDADAWIEMDFGEVDDPLTLISVSQCKRAEHDILLWCLHLAHEDHQLREA